MIKTYSIEKSPFYCCRRKSKIALLLRTPLRELKFLSNGGQYSERYEVQGKKSRLIEDPRFPLKKVQRRFRELLARISAPDWLMSGIKGRSIIDNAKVHQDSTHLLKVDIESFYQNCNREFIFKFFHQGLNCSEDVSWLLTDLVTYKGHLPTGSPTSQIIAFWAYKKVFEKIYNLAEENNLNMTLYVDDIVISGKKHISKNIPQKINRELKKVGLNIKKGKSRFYFSKDFKIVTGVAISPDHKLLVPNKRRKKMMDMISSCDFENLEKKEKVSLLGSIISARQIEKQFFPSLYRKARI